LRQAAAVRLSAKGRPQVVEAVPVPAPIGGWNARDPLADMDPKDAVILENWFPRVSDCIIRGGSSDYVSGFTAIPKTLAVYNPPTAANKLFAVTDAGVYDVTSSGLFGANLAARTAGYHNWVQMGVSGASYLMLFNGVDKPLYFDGTTWILIDGASTPAITGVTTTGLVFGAVFKRRLFLIENNKLSFWFITATDAVGGAASEFLLGPLCSKGGYLMAIGSWTFDGGQGPDDYGIFVTSEGEIIIFKGTDPGSSANWALVGVFQVGAKPLGRKCLMKFGGDLVIITEFGVLPLSKILQTVATELTQAVSAKIINAFVDAARSYGANQGWEALLYPAQNAMLVNVPTVVGSTYQQYVMNTVTKNWCKFTGWNGDAFALFNKELYFAGNVTRPTYMSLPGTNGNFASAPNSAAQSITGDIDIRVKIAADTWTPASLTRYFVSKFQAVATPYPADISFRFGLATNGTFTWERSTDGSNGAGFAFVGSSVAVGFAAFSLNWVRVTYAAATGTTIFYTSSDGVTWTQLGTTQSTGAGNIFASNSQLEIGSDQNGGETLAGKFYYVEIRNGINGTVARKFNPLFDATSGATTFTSSTGEVWTILQSGSPKASLVNTTVGCVSKAWTGRSDAGASIVANAQTAFNYFDKRTQAKQWKLVRPQLLVDGPLNFSIGLAVDFQITNPLSIATYTTTGGASWDVDLWGTGMWGAGLEIRQAWQTPAAPVGYCASGLLQIATNALEVRWVSTEYVFEDGGVLG
jgi:hypothetical protein